MARLTLALLLALTSCQVPAALPTPTPVPEPTPMPQCAERTAVRVYGSDPVVVGAMTNRLNRHLADGWRIERTDPDGSGTTYVLCR